MTQKPSGPTGQMLKGPIGTRRMEKGPRRDFYDELQALRMSNCRSHKYTLDGEGIECVAEPSESYGPHVLTIVFQTSGSST
jgi:hypothetical protein